MGGEDADLLKEIQGEDEDDDMREEALGEGKE